MDIRPDRPDFRRLERQRPDRRGPERAEGTEQRAAAQRLANQVKAERVQNARAENARIEGIRQDGAEIDRLDLSEGARAAERLTEGGTSPDRLAALRELYQSGRLNSPERLRTAAEQILGQRTPFGLG